MPKIVALKIAITPAESQRGVFTIGLRVIHDPLSRDFGLNGHYAIPYATVSISLSVVSSMSISIVAWGQTAHPPSAHAEVAASMIDLIVLRHRPHFLLQPRQP